MLDGVLTRAVALILGDDVNVNHMDKSCATSAVRCQEVPYRVPHEHSRSITSIDMRRFLADRTVWRSSTQLIAHGCAKRHSIVKAHFDVRVM